MLEEEFNLKQRALQEKVGARNALQAKLREHEAEVVQLTERMTNTEKAVLLIQAQSESQQAMLSARIESIVTAGIRAVFQDEKLTFKLRYSETKKGGVKKQPEVSMSVLYEHDGKQVEGGLKDSFGGGLSVVVGVLLNVVVLLNLQPRVAPVLFLDEPLAALSPNYEGASSRTEYRERMADFIRTLVNETDLQVILVTHESNYSETADYSHVFHGGIGKPATVKTIERTT